MTRRRIEIQTFRERVYYYLGIIYIYGSTESDLRFQQFIKTIQEY